MTQIAKYTSIILLALLFIWSCKPKELTLSEKTKIESFGQAINSKEYSFVPTSANPMSYKTINLTSSYYLKISGDTIKAYLPYFGRSYTAPTDPSDIGIDFTSTDADYSVETKKDTWEVSIRPKDIDKNRGIQLFLSIGNGGYGNLRIQEPNRQAISYYGTIEINK